MALSLAALRDPQGGVEGYVATFEDITERRRQAEALAEIAAPIRIRQRLLHRHWDEGSSASEARNSAAGICVQHGSRHGF